jgi:hypothetical protein
VAFISSFATISLRRAFALFEPSGTSTENGLLLLIMGGGLVAMGSV